MKWQIKFCYIFLFIVGFILLVTGIVSITRILFVSSFFVNILFIIFAILDIIAAYFIYNLKTRGRTLGLIAGWSGLFGQSLILSLPFIFILNILGVSFHLGIPVIIFVLAFTFIIITLSKKENKELFVR